MMFQFLKITAVAVFFCSNLTVVQAQTQKVGHLNFGSLLSTMPEARKADTILVNLSDTLVGMGQARMAKFQAAYEGFMAQSEAGKLTPLQEQQGQDQLRKEYEMIGQLEKVIEDSVMQRRAELLEPIVTNVQRVVNEVAKENGYNFIFDASLPNTILFANDSDDIIELVKKKLGIK